VKPSGRPRGVEVWLRYAAGRAGVPHRRSFEAWVAAALRGAGRTRPAGVAILVADEPAAREFNRRYRGRKRATNVLSFPADPLPDGDARAIGDIVLCAPVVAREAREQGKPVRDHYAHLTVHGVLHLLGHEHEVEADAERMEALERRILARLGIRDPYAVDA